MAAHQIDWCGNLTHWHDGWMMRQYLAIEREERDKTPCLTIHVGATGLDAGTTGYGFFAECPRLCRVFFIGHSAKRLFAEC